MESTGVLGLPSKPRVRDELLALQLGHKPEFMALGVHLPHEKLESKTLAPNVCRCSLLPVRQTCCLGRVIIVPGPQGNAIRNYSDPYTR